jgi:hypothetical protein
MHFAFVPWCSGAARLIGWMPLLLAQLLRVNQIRLAYVPSEH